jgi:hypothetical protein
LKGGKKIMEFKVKAPVELPDGGHEGTIVRLEERTEPYHYIDIFIKVKDKDFETKYGVPANISIDSKFGKLLTAFGMELKPGETVNPEPALLNRNCMFMTIKEKSKDGNEYSRVVDGSVKPKE